MTHREDPNRGVWKSVCERCTATAACRLVMVADRYLWTCTDVRECTIRAIDLMDPAGVLAKPEVTR